MVIERKKKSLARGMGGRRGISSSGLRYYTIYTYPNMFEYFMKSEREAQRSQITGGKKPQKGYQNKGL